MASMVLLVCLPCSRLRMEGFGGSAWDHTGEASHGTLTQVWRQRKRTGAACTHAGQNPKQLVHPDGGEGLRHSHSTSNGRGPTAPLPSCGLALEPEVGGASPRFEGPTGQRSAHRTQLSCPDAGGIPVDAQEGWLGASAAGVAPQHSGREHADGCWGLGWGGVCRRCSDQRRGVAINAKLVRTGVGCSLALPRRSCRVFFFQRWPDDPKPKAGHLQSDE